MWEEEYDNGDKHDSCDTQPYLFKPKVDHSEILWMSFTLTSEKLSTLFLVGD